MKFRLMLSAFFALALAAVPAASLAQVAPTPPGYSSMAGAKTLALTTSSDRTTLPSTSASFGAVTVYNNGTVAAYFAIGSSTVTAATSGTCATGSMTSCYLAPGTFMTVWAGVGNTHIAGITGSSTSTLVIYQATGPVQFGKAVNPNVDGTVTSVSQGTGIVATPNPITDTGTIAIDTAVVPRLAVANTFTANQTVSGASFGLSGAISAPAWTTSGVRYKNVGGTLTDTTSTGTVATAYSSVWGGNTIAASNSTTFTNYIGAFFGNPTAGTNVTITNPTALGADSLSIGGAARGTNEVAITGEANISGGLGIGTDASSTALINILAATNAARTVTIINTSTSGSANAQFIAGNGAAATDQLRVISYSSGYTGGFPATADSGAIYARSGLSGGLVIATEGTAPIEFGINSASIGTMTTTGLNAMAIGQTTAALITGTTVRANTAFNFNGTTGASQVCAGAPTAVTVSGGIITSITC